MSREWGAGPPILKKAEAKKTLVKRSAAGGVLGLGKPVSLKTATEGDRSKVRQTQSSVTVRRVGSMKGKVKLAECPRVVTDEIPVGDAKDIGTPDAPIWNHTCQL